MQRQGRVAKRRKAPQRSRVYQTGDRPGFSRRGSPSQARRSGISLLAIAAGLVGVVVLGAAVVYVFMGTAAGPPASPSPSPSPPVVAPATFNVGPPSATPLANPPASPEGDGTTATIATELGDITFEVFTESAPVASENFINLAEAGYYDGVVFHRIVPDFMIQGGDPEGTGMGGPGYTIPDEPVVGEYVRGTVAMARSQAPNSQGSQFFIVVSDSSFLEGGGYTIFGRVTSGMEVVDEIVSMPSAEDDPGGRGGTALDPVAMTSVTIERP